MSSRFIHVVGCTRIFFLFKADYYSTVRTEHALLFIHLLDTWVFSQASVFLKLQMFFCGACFSGGSQWAGLLRLQHIRPVGVTPALVPRVLVVYQVQTAAA